MNILTRFKQNLTKLNKNGLKLSIVQCELQDGAWDFKTSTTSTSIYILQDLKKEQ